MKHKQHDEVLKWLSTRPIGGGPIPVWLWGAPGAGKTHLAEQIAEDLKLNFYPIYLGPTTTESKVLGFRNASLGEYVPGLAVEPYEKGGLLYLDESDNCDASVLVSTNSLLSNKTYRFPDGRMCARHPDFTVLAGANTLGTGSTQGFKRHAQDAALRSRFVKVRFEYDEALEHYLGDGLTWWVEWVHRVRRFVGTQAKSNYWITSREIMYGAAAIQSGMNIHDVLKATVFAEMTPDFVQLVVANCGLPGEAQKEPPLPNIPPPQQSKVIPTKEFAPQGTVWNQPKPIQNPYKKPFSKGKVITDISELVALVEDAEAGKFPKGSVPKFPDKKP